jgi:hypothetical protein
VLGSRRACEGRYVLKDSAMIDELDLLYLGAPAGNGQANDPTDIAALDNSLRRIEAYTPPPEYVGEPQRYATEPMIRSLEKFQEQNGLKIDGYANPGGPTERAINNSLLAKPRGAGLLFDPPASLAGMVGNGFENRPGDVAVVKRLLGAAGDLPEDPFDRPRGYIDDNTTRAIQSFQRKKGLADDGWLAPGGETERALHDAVSDLARAKGGDWLKYAERAGRAQARLSDTLESRPLAFGRPTNTVDRRPDGGTNAESEGEIIPVQSRGGLGRLPTQVPPWIGVAPETDEITPGSPADLLRRFFDSAGRYTGRVMLPRNPRRESLPESEKPGSRTILVPPRVPDEPFRGPDPAKPPLDPKLTRPSPYPSESPHKPEPERITPPRIDPRNFVEILPDQSEWIAHLPIIVENRQGFAPVKDLNRELGKPVIGIGQKIFPGANITQTGGPTPNPAQGYSEEFDEFRDKKKFGITSNAGGSFKDASYLFEYNGVKFRIVINTVTTSGPNAIPVPRENRQRAKNGP